MSSIYRDKWESEAEEELKYLEDKKSRIGWTQADAEKYNDLLEELNR